MAGGKGDVSMKNDFIPRRDGDLDSFEENFINKIDIHIPVLQLQDEAGETFVVSLLSKQFISPYSDFMISTFPYSTI